METAATLTPEALYESVSPLLPLGLPFAPTLVNEDWFDWPALPELFPASFPGVKTSRDSFLVDVDPDRLRAQVADYFDAKLSDEEITRRYPGVMQSTARFNARAVRNTLLVRGGPMERGFIRYAYRPFDTRWLYWEAETKLLGEKSAEYRPHVFDGNRWLVTPQKQRKEWSPPLLVRNLGDLNHMDGGASYLPIWLRDPGFGAYGTGLQENPNLSPKAQRYLERLGMGVEELFYHALAVLHDPSYRQDNAGALRMEWPRIPLPGWTEFSAPALRRGGSRTAPTVAVNGNAPSADQSVIPAEAGIQTPTDAADSSVIPVKTRPVPGRGIHPAFRRGPGALAASAARGRQLAQLLDSDTPVPGVTAGTLRTEIAAIAVPATSDDRNMTGNDFALTAGWGHYGAGEAVMPGQGKVTERAYTPAERDALPSRHSGASRNPELPSQPKPLRQGETANRAPESISAASILGDTTFDIYLNNRAYWRNVPANVWHYKLGGYQVLKKWLSYREHTILKRPLKPEEVQHFTDTARRIGALLLLTARSTS